MSKKVQVNDVLAQLIYEAEEALEIQEQGNQADYYIDYGEFSGECDVGERRSALLSYVVGGLYDRMKAETGLDYSVGYETEDEIEFEKYAEQQMGEEELRYHEDHRHQGDVELIAAEFVARYGPLDMVRQIVQGREVLIRINESWTSKMKRNIPEW